MISRLRKPSGVVIVALVATLLLVPGRADAGYTATFAEPAPVVLTAESEPAKADRRATVVFRLADADGTPIAGATLGLDRGDSYDRWSYLWDGVTDESGEVTLRLRLSRIKAGNRVRARFEGDEDHAPARVRHTVEIIKRDGRLTLTGPDGAVEGRSITLRAQRTAKGDTVPGPITLLRKRRAQKDWRVVDTRRAGAKGVATFEVSPRARIRYRAVAPSSHWLKRVRSAVHTVDLLPAGTPVALPAGAPEPRVKLPAQRRAVGKGAHPVITGIGNRVWNDMTGRSWHAGCPVGRSGLRLLRINYWDYDGFRRRGELVAASGAIGNMAAALREMYRRQLPIRSMYRVDRFGWSGRLKGADDYKSMAAGNTSAFNCRNVVGRPGVRSPHSYGRSLDINPWENPYRSPQGTYPNTWWLGHSHPRVAWRSSSHAVVSVMRNHGLRWTYGSSDLHHFDVAYAGGRVAVPRGCAAVSCH